jgi:hypothetical protein
LRGGERVADRFRMAGFETILSIGETDENRIGSNCGMRVRELDGLPATRRILRNGSRRPGLS